MRSQGALDLKWAFRGVAPGQWSPTFLGPGTDFHGRQLSHELGGREGLKMIQAHYTLCTLFLLLLHQLYLRSWGIRSEVGDPCARRYRTYSPLCGYQQASRETEELYLLVFLILFPNSKLGVHLRQTLPPKSVHAWPTYGWLPVKMFCHPKKCSDSPPSQSKQGKECRWQK